MFKNTLQDKNHLSLYRQKTFPVFMVTFILLSIFSSYFGAKDAFAYEIKKHVCTGSEPSGSAAYEACKGRKGQTTYIVNDGGRDVQRSQLGAVADRIFNIIYEDFGIFGVILGILVGVYLALSGSPMKGLMMIALPSIAYIFALKIAVTPGSGYPLIETVSTASKDNLFELKFIAHSLRISLTMMFIGGLSGLFFWIHNLLIENGVNRK